MNYKRLSHVVWDCKYHLVVVPKYRYKVFDQPVTDDAGHVFEYAEQDIHEQLRKDIQNYLEGGL